MNIQILPALFLLSCSIAPAENTPVSCIPNNQNAIALTFDDGPHAEFTPAILDILDRCNIKATFYQIGSRMKKFPKLSYAVINAGHEIGNHTMNHPKLPELATKTAIGREIQNFQKTQNELFGISARTFRPPYFQMDDRVWKILNTLPLPAITANVHGDYKGCDAITDPAVSKEHVNRLIDKVSSGAIILMHERAITTNYLEKVIQGLQGKGFTFLTVSELIDIRQ